LDHKLSFRLEAVTDNSFFPNENMPKTTTLKIPAAVKNIPYSSLLSALFPKSTEHASMFSYVEHFTSFEQIKTKT
jgi:hypothetical protein